MSFEIKCNIPACGSALGENTQVASCGHSFCAAHGAERLVNATCPLCSKQVGSISLNFSKKYIAECKGVLLLGFSPGEIVEAAGAALDYWSNQKQLELVQLKALESSRDQVFRDKMRSAYAAYTELKENYEGLDKSCAELKQVNEALESDNKRLLQKTQSPVVFDPPTNTIVSEITEFGGDIFAGFHLETAQAFKKPSTPFQRGFYAPLN